MSSSAPRSNGNLQLLQPYTFQLSFKGRTCKVLLHAAAAADIRILGACGKSQENDGSLAKIKQPILHALQGLQKSRFFQSIVFLLVETARPPFLVEKSFRNPMTMCDETFERHLGGKKRRGIVLVLPVSSLHIGNCTTFLLPNVRHERRLVQVVLPAVTAALWTGRGCSVCRWVEATKMQSTTNPGSVSSGKRPSSHCKLSPVWGNLGDVIVSKAFHVR